MSSPPPAAAAAAAADEPTAKRPRLDEELPTAVEGLGQLQAELEQVNDEASDRVLQIEQEYNRIRRPIYLRRAEFIRKIPNFWITAFENCRTLVAFISDDDADALQYLEDVDVQDFDDIKSGYRITFAFRANPYFEEARLTKEYRFGEDGRLTIAATPITWKPGKALTGDPEAEEESGHWTSFFCWFRGNDGAGNEALQYHDQRDDIAAAIKDDVWPDPLKYYNNEAEPDMGEEEEEGEGEGDDALGAADGNEEWYEGDDVEDPEAYDDDDGGEGYEHGDDDGGGEGYEEGDEFAVEEGEEGEEDYGEGEEGDGDGGGGGGVEEEGGEYYEEEGGGGGAEGSAAEGEEDAAAAAPAGGEGEGGEEPGAADEGAK